VITAPFKSAIEATAARLREKVMSEAEGAFLGNEDRLQGLLGASRATIRQAARLLEREGLLLVRRGINGGYFGTRPTADTIEKSVSTYLEMLKVSGDDLITVSSVLWVEAMRKAAALGSPEAKALAAQFLGEIDRLPDDTGFQTIRELETKFRAALFDLIDSRYIELIFQINMTFAMRRFPSTPSSQDGTRAHRDFVREWREARRMELNALADGDADLGAMAARHFRNVWSSRIWAQE
jgi:DNA-binding FadR family transcriptional regulator